MQRFRSWLSRQPGNRALHSSRPLSQSCHGQQRGLGTTLSIVSWPATQQNSELSQRRIEAHDTAIIQGGKTLGQNDHTCEGGKLVGRGHGPI